MRLLRKTFRRLSKYKTVLKYKERRSAEANRADGGVTEVSSCKLLRREPSSENSTGGVDSRGDAHGGFQCTRWPRLIRQTQVQHVRAEDKRRELNRCSSAGEARDTENQEGETRKRDVEISQRNANTPTHMLTGHKTSPLPVRATI